MLVWQKRPKTLSGFSTKEIAGSLLLKLETVKKRLSRARKAIKEKNIKFELPNHIGLDERLDSVHEVLYLIFNEGFHSGNKEFLVRKDLCGEAMRLTKFILENEQVRNERTYAYLR